MIKTIEKNDKNVAYYYRINSTYELYYNPLDSDDPDIIKAREVLYDRLGGLIPDKYEKFSTSLSMTQLKDSFNFLLTYGAFFRSLEGLPMQEYVEAEEIKKKAEKEIEEFLDSIGCEFKKINIISFC